MTYAPSTSTNGTSTSGASRPAWSGGRPNASNPLKDRTITRLACLKAAAMFAASRPDATSEGVLKVAASWEAWVNRSGA